jgi:hypothetical protein
VGWNQKPVKRGGGVRSRDLLLEQMRDHAYTLKRGRSVVSGTSVHRRALIRRASDLTENGEGGGIVSLLLPTDLRSRKRLTRDKKFDLVLVRTRSVGLRGVIRQGAASSRLIDELTAIAPVRPNWRKKDFVHWLWRELQNPMSAARKIVDRIAPDLLEAERSYSWWYRNLRMKQMSR